MMYSANGSVTDLQTQKQNPAKLGTCLSQEKTHHRDLNLRPTEYEADVLTTTL